VARAVRAAVQEEDVVHAQGRTAGRRRAAWASYPRMTPSPQSLIPLAAAVDSPGGASSKDERWFVPHKWLTSGPAADGRYRIICHYTDRGGRHNTSRQPSLLNRRIWGSVLANLRAITIRTAGTPPEIRRGQTTATMSRIGNGRYTRRDQIKNYTASAIVTSTTALSHREQELYRTRHRASFPRRG
jgi:hypothetical protein